MSKSWERVAQERQSRQMREGVFSSRRFWIGFLTTAAILIAGYAVVGMVVG